MKKFMALALALVLLLTASVAFAETDAPTLEDLAGLDWSFSSGAGAWATELTCDANGNFTGMFHDSDMGVSDAAYPGGTVYISVFSGELSILEKVDDYAWRVSIDLLSLEYEPGDEWIEDEVRYVVSEPYGLSEGDEMLLFLPGTPVDALTEDMQMWAHLIWQDPTPTELDCWFLYSPANESGFVGYESL